MKYIDAEKLIAEIERLAKTYQDSIWRTVKGETAKDFRDKLLAFITSLQQEQLVEGLEAEVRRWIHAQRNNGRKVFGWIDMVELAARHFYELGLKSKK